MNKMHAAVLSLSALFLFACEDTTAKSNWSPRFDQGRPSVSNDMGTMLDVLTEMDTEATPNDSADMMPQIDTDSTVSEPANDAGSVDAEIISPDYDSCEALDGCVVGCTDDDCIDDCLERSSETSKEEWQTLNTCLETNACRDDNGNVAPTCLSGTCRTEFVTCFGEDALPMAPSSDCAALAACDTACSGETECRAECADNATVAARLAFRTYLQCSMDMGPSNCDEEYAACFGAEEGIACNEILECIFACDEETCEADCVAQGSPNAQTQWNAFDDCESAADCAIGDYACLRRECEQTGLDCLKRFPVPTGNLTCEEYVSCAVACDVADSSCPDECLRETDPNGYNTFVDLFACLDRNDCFELDGDDYSECVASFCTTQSDRCFDPNAVPRSGSCIDLYECIELCEPDDTNCASLCRDATSLEGLTDAQAHITCLESSTCDVGDYTCRAIDCSTEIEACFGSVPLPEGMSSCNDTLMCLGECSNSGLLDTEIESCETACIAAASPEAYNAYVSIFACFDGSGCNGDPICEQNICAAELNTCDLTPAPLPENLDCEGLFECGDRCGASDICLDNCIESTDPAELDLAINYLECRPDGFCAENDYACAAEFCIDEESACFGPATFPSGFDTCDEFYTCMDSCFLPSVTEEAQTTCVNACIETSSSEGYNAYTELLICYSESGCGQNQSCQSSRCGDELNACFDEPALPDNGLSCGEYVDCRNACAPGDVTCLLDCEFLATGTALAGYGAIEDCQNLRCNFGLADPTPECTNQECSAQLDACYADGAGN